MTRHALELVNHPAHYQTAAGIEAIDVIERYGLDASYHLANAMKYLLRAGRKDEIALDLAKADWYLRRWIDQYLDGYAFDPVAREGALAWASPEAIVEAFGLGRRFATGDEGHVDGRTSAIIHLLEMATEPCNTYQRATLARVALGVALQSFNGHVARCVRIFEKPTHVAADMSAGYA